MSAYVFCFSLGFGNMVARLTLTIAVVQRLKCKSKFKKVLLTTGHDHGRIRNNTFDPLFQICSRLMGFASVLKVFVGVLNAKLVVDSCLNSGFAASFQVFSVVIYIYDKWYYHEFSLATTSQKTLDEWWICAFGGQFIQHLGVTVYQFYGATSTLLRVVAMHFGFFCGCEEIKIVTCSIGRFPEVQTCFKTYHVVEDWRIG